MAFVYILLSEETQKTYVGSTTDLDRRIKEHNNGENLSTKRHIPWKVFYKEEYENLAEARVREKYLKSCTGRKFIKNLFKSKF
ncbi:MAG: GIY-YIG nuclease family protein [Candidatus Portnoybacteria bacterium]|nr:GIY-YIG nuclease family protein [Candidatus Portnoybacteria bacterium]